MRLDPNSRTANVIFAAIMVLLLVAGCTGEYVNQHGQQRTSPTLTKETSVWGYSIVTVEGHDYLRYRAGNNCGLTHHPECECLNDKTE